MRDAVGPDGHLAQRVVELAEELALVALRVRRAPVRLAGDHALADPRRVDEVGVDAGQVVQRPGFRGPRDQLVLVAPVVLAQRVGVGLVPGGQLVAVLHPFHAAHGRPDLRELLSVVAAPDQLPTQELERVVLDQLDGVLLLAERQHEPAARTGAVPVREMVVGVHPLVEHGAVATGVGQVDDRHRAVRARVRRLEVRSELAVPERADSEVQPAAEPDVLRVHLPERRQIHEGVVGVVQVVLALLGGHVLAEPHVGEPEGVLHFVRGDVAPAAVVRQAGPVHPVQPRRHQGVLAGVALVQRGVVLLLPQSLRPTRLVTEQPEVLSLLLLDHAAEDAIARLGELDTPARGVMCGVRLDEALGVAPHRFFQWQTLVG